ncbi:hypothetical protein LJR220_003295 [Bradyrhizobium sp. LjRoot220]|uniref:hypothetical protein n=1 Tax=Bradyrhizobium sp. LjRoot220 TaxID=3342284 RepID=UPI003ED13784
MKWMKERDLLIAQTMAFVQSVTGKKPDLDQFVGKASAIASPEAPATSEAPKATPAVSMPDIEAMLAETVAAPPPKPALAGRTEPKVDFQSEIRARVANFRAHQERFNREREAYCSATMAKVHASLHEDTGVPRPGK